MILEQICIGFNFIQRQDSDNLCSRQKLTYSPEKINYGIPYDSTVDLYSQMFAEIST